MKSLRDQALDAFMTLEAAIAFARLRECPGILGERMDVGELTPQTTLSAVAATAIRYGPPTGPDYDWAWGVMEQVARMREPKGHFFGSRIPWHPVNHLIAALAHDRRSVTPRKDSARVLLQLKAHPIEGVAQLAFSALFSDHDAHVSWVAAQLAIDRSYFYRSEATPDGRRNDAVGREARENSLARALKRLDEPGDTPLPEVPPAWAKTTSTRPSRRSQDENPWDDPVPSFDAQFASKFLSLFPIEAWCEFCNLPGRCSPRRSRSCAGGRPSGSCRHGRPAVAGNRTTAGPISASGIMFSETYWRAPRHSLARSKYAATS